MQKHIEGDRVAGVNLHSIKESASSAPVLSTAFLLRRLSPSTSLRPRQVPSHSYQRSKNDTKTSRYIDGTMKRSDIIGGGHSAKDYRCRNTSYSVVVCHRYLSFCFMPPTDTALIRLIETVSCDRPLCLVLFISKINGMSS